MIQNNIGGYQMNKYFRIYGKDSQMQNYKAFDYSTGSFVDKLIYATIIKESEYEKAIKAVEFMNMNNPNYHFELREVK